MVTLSLHRTARIQEQIRAFIGAQSLESHARLSIFTTDVDAEVERLSRELTEAIARLQRLLSILADLRAAVGQQNAATGINALLAQKAAADEEIALMAKLLDDPSEKSRGLDLWGPKRRREQTPAARSQISLEEQIRASRTRFEAGEDGEDEIRVPLLDAAQQQAIRFKILDQRRRLEEIAEQLRALNSTGTVEIADETLAFLREAGVI